MDRDGVVGRDLVGGLDEDGGGHVVADRQHLDLGAGLELVCVSRGTPQPIACQGFAPRRTQTELRAAAAAHGSADPDCRLCLASPAGLLAQRGSGKKRLFVLWIGSAEAQGGLERPAPRPTIV
eukprot:scaffold200787_cov19-Prasinocladus_malaysianus.AAC.1